MLRTQILKGGGGLYSPHVSIVDGTQAINIFSASSETFECTFDSDGNLIKPQPNDEIWYTSTDGNIVNPYKTGAFGANIVSNTYTEGKGIIRFDGNVTSIGDYAFQSCDRLTNINIPNSVTSIGNQAFSYCSSLISFNIPNSVTSIGDYAFISCSSLPVENNLRYADTYLVGATDKSLRTYTIKEGTKWIGGSAFYGCRSLTGITIPNSVTSINSGAFCECYDLDSIIIPSGVTSIGDWAFKYDSGLEEVICNPTTPPTLGDEAFTSYREYRINFKVPAGSVDTYKAATNWSKYSSQIISQ